ncbi:MAG: hypothetical protein ACI8QZ_001568 [Chlamydiales bacterium]|jgi:hypothetical protein
MKLEMTIAFLLFSTLGACCLPPKAEATSAEGALGTAPGGDCVITINPSQGGFGASFGMGYQFNGSEGSIGSDTSYIIQITSSQDIIDIGARGGTRVTLTKGETYDIVIKNLEGPKVEVFNQNNPGENYKISVDDHGSDYKASGFAVITRDLKADGIEYVSVIITKDGKGVRFEVNE